MAWSTGVAFCARFPGRCSVGGHTVLMVVLMSPPLVKVCPTNPATFLRLYYLPGSHSTLVVTLNTISTSLGCSLRNSMTSREKKCLRALKSKSFSKTSSDTAHGMTKETQRNLQGKTMLKVINTARKRSCELAREKPHHRGFLKESKRRASTHEPYHPDTIDRRSA